ncbi:MAG TPA: toprim domain-containing protein [Tepidisphaeraceae bacterium]|nr:toprim domain-containing protein [Tepidisphaeraceae bacterium]
MVDAAGVVIGIRLRTLAGDKYAVKGGREGLFLPRALRGGGALYITEGPTDCAAMLDLGLDAVGRPSCTGGAHHLVTLIRRLRPREVVIVGDDDDPGRRGAESLAVILLAHSVQLRVIYPPPEAKDVRIWKIAGAIAADVEALVTAAPVRRLRVRRAGKGTEGGTR